VGAAMTRVYFMDDTAYGAKGQAEQPPPSALLDSVQCPCWTCAYRVTCRVECSRFKAYLDSPTVSGSRRRNYSVTCAECRASFKAVTSSTKWCSERCRVASRRKRAASTAL